MQTTRHILRLLEERRHESLRSLLCTHLDGHVRGLGANGRLRPYRLAHDVWRELLGTSEAAWTWRARFLAEASRPLRRILLHHARERRLAQDELTLDLAGWPLRGARVGALDFDAALVRLAFLDTTRCRLVVLRDLAGLSVDEAAVELDLSPAAALREWSWARTGLLRDLGLVQDPRPSAAAARA